jgi:hypothetical protein
VFGVVCLSFACLRLMYFKTFFSHEDSSSLHLQICLSLPCGFVHNLRRFYLQICAIQTKTPGIDPKSYQKHFQLKFFSRSQAKSGRKVLVAGIDFIARQFSNHRNFIHKKKSQSHHFRGEIETNFELVIVATFISLLLVVSSRKHC